MRAAAAWGVVLLVAVAYPLAVLAGGSPRFPSRSECSTPAVEGQPIEAVFGSFDAQRDAEAEQTRARHAGFEGTALESDACGRVKLVIRGIPSLQVGRGLVEEARGAGFEVTLERGG
jgi:hypothetical protein